MIKENEAIKDRVIRDIRNLFEHEEEHYKLVRIGNFWSSNYIEYESNGNRDKTLSTDEYLNKITTINLIPSKDNDEERVMHSNSNNTEFMIYDNTD